MPHKWKDRIEVSDYTDISLAIQLASSPVSHDRVKILLLPVSLILNKYSPSESATKTTTYTRTKTKDKTGNRTKHFHKKVVCHRQEPSWMNAFPLGGDSLVQ